MSELLPCPFCGGEAHISASSDGYGVECWNRRCIDMQMDELPTEAEAIDAWNTRAERTCHIEHMPKNKELRMPPWIECSECGGELPLLTTANYCPNCGAKVV